MKLSLRLKLTVTAGLTVVVLILLGISTYFSIYSISSIYDLKNNVGALENNALQLRQNEKDFMLVALMEEDFYKTNSSKYLTTFNQVAKQADSLLIKFETNDIIESNNLQNRVNSLSSELKKYQDAFDETVKLIIERGYGDYGLINEIDKVLEINQLVNNTKLSKYVTELNKLENDYNLFRSVSFRETFLSKYTQTIDYVNSISIGNNVKEEILNKLEYNHKNFLRIIEIDQNINVENQGLSKIIRESMIKLSAESTELSELVSEYSTSSIRRVLTFQIALIIAFIILVVIINTLVLRKIFNQLGGDPTEVEFITQEIAEGNLAIEIEDGSKRKGVLHSLHLMLEKLKEVIEQIHISAEKISLASNQLGGGAEQLSNDASIQAATSEQVSSSIDEMAANIEQNAENALTTKNIAVNAKDGILNVAKATNESITATKQITEEISIINDIAFQTNILALNAAVEAARAGTHGKGFAVVAGEVRKLAERSKEAADQINTLSAESMKVSEDSGELMAKLLPEIEKTAKLVQEISTATSEQSSGANQISQSIQELSSVTQRNMTSSDDVASNSEELSSQAKQLKSVVNFFILKRTVQHNPVPDNGELKQNEIRNPKKGINEKGINIKLNPSDQSFDDFETF